MSFNARQLSLRGLRTFCVAARHGSFRLAAQELFITASAVSHQIKNLEQELGVRLFERQVRSLELTEDGRTLFEAVDTLVRRVEEVAAELQSHSQRASLRVSVQPFFASELFVPRLAEFTSIHPEIDIRVDTSDDATEKHPASADVSIRLFRSPPKGLASDFLFPIRLVPACSPDLRAGLEIVDGRIDQPLPMIVLADKPNGWKSWSESAGIGLPTPSNVIRLDSMIAVARAAERGLGAALVPLPLADSSFQSGSLVRLFDHEVTSQDGYFLVYNEEDGHRGEIQALRAWVIEAFGQDR